MATKPKYDSKRLIQTAKNFFSKCSPGEIPPELQSVGAWIALNGEWYWVLFYLTEPSLLRVREYQKKKWHPFPGLFSPTESSSALIAMDGTDGFFESNITENSYAFRVGRNASFILHNHRHSITDYAGKRADYLVDLAFVVGINNAAKFKTTEMAFSHLFKYLSKVWSGKR
jgi:hypothetical protein